jgi:AcrR family transcriptional regulator
MKRTEKEKNDSTEAKIKEAARKVFTTKGYAATRTRDIAEESGYNLALINYYFRSKEKLFEIVMVETLQSFISSIKDIINDEHTTLPQKLEILVSHYIDMLIQTPGLPLFLLNEINANPKKLLTKVGVDIAIKQTVAGKQMMEIMKGVKLPINPIHIVMNAVAVTIFPFIGAPLIKEKMGLDTPAFNALMEERKKLIPVWVQQWLGGRLAANG